MIQILNNLAMFVGYLTLAANALVGTLIIASMWVDGVRDWFRQQREERDRREAVRWVPDEITLRRQMRSKVG